MRTIAAQGPVPEFTRWQGRTRWTQAVMVHLVEPGARQDPERSEQIDNLLRQVYFGQALSNTPYMDDPAPSGFGD